MTTRMTGAEFLADTLQGYGVSHVFLVPAVLSRTLYEMEARTSIGRIVAHGEKAAAYMADGYARASGKPGICMAQSVGAANLAAGLRDAYMACSPVIAITGGPYLHSRHKNQYQQIDDFPIFEPLTKYNARVDLPERIPEMIRQAFRVATTGRPGPVHLEFAGHAAEIEATECVFEVVVEERFSHVPAFRVHPEPAAVHAAAEVLANAERPIIVAGGGVRQSDAAAELVALAEKMGIPVATSMNAKDVIDGLHPLSVGVPGLYGRKSANLAVMEADVVFFVGSKTGSQLTSDWRVPAPGARVIHLDIDPEELGRHYSGALCLLGDAKVALGALMEVTDATAERRRSWVERVQRFVADWREGYAAALGSDAVPIRPERLCSELSQHLPSDAIVVSDTGHSGMWTGIYLDLKRGQSFVRCAGSLGWGLPAALGAQLAVPDRPVVMFSGDGGFYYHLAELETAARWGIGATLIVNNNRSLNQERYIFAPAYGGTLHGRHTELWHHRDIDFVAVAESLGATGIRVKKPGDFAAAVEQGIATPGPTVIDVVSDIDAMAPFSEGLTTAS
ncbi:thiamine pyrophosphate-binding protein [Nocardia sp. CA-129566]|uniref:thiamine pyrophosphate-binding protein n=1 Tax=Nocardia sp. CA-129566 TaxID=3239976 RepID=UPI003D998B37